MAGVELAKLLTNFLGDEVIDSTPVSGGCISKSELITTASGRSFFLKSGSVNEKQFEAEAVGLKELAKAGEFVVPRVILYGADFLLLERIEQGNAREGFQYDFGYSLGKMHRHYSQVFGFESDNFIGLTPQLNVPNEEECKDWCKFYFNKRLAYQFYLAEENGYVDHFFRKCFGSIENKIETILKGSNERPSLLHGDLWGGNYLVGTQGECVLIDPAVYYGHREADIAMTKLFGGFSTDFYQGYNDEHPLLAGYDYRERIYLLYHVLNHLNLFGEMYKSQALELMLYYQ